jgi:tRNA 2-thiocytidine biosynthesis protein TtcA
MTTYRKFHKSTYENNKLSKRLFSLAGKAVKDYNMIEDGDRIMVCMSGGKDSYALLDILMVLQSRAPIYFDLIAVNLDMNLPGFPKALMPEYLKQKGVPFHIETQDTYSIIERLIPTGKAICSLCSRLRRGILYNLADKLGVTKIALGHHRDDILETFFLNLFFSAKIKGMPPKLKTDDGRHIVIRPMAYIKESDLERFSEIHQYPLIPKGLCGAKENPQRRQIKQMVKDWEKQYKGRVENIFSALSTLVPSHLMDRTMYDFINLHQDKKSQEDREEVDEKPFAFTPADGLSSKEQ